MPIVRMALQLYTGERLDIRNEKRMQPHFLSLRFSQQRSTRISPL